MKNCESTRRDQILNLLMNGLSGAEETIVRNHIDSCSACKEYYDRLTHQVEVFNRFGNSINQDMKNRRKRTVQSLKQFPSSVFPHVSLWRKIMYNKLTKFAVATVILVAVGFIINRLGGSVDLASVSFAQVQKAMNNIPWIHLSFSGEGRDDRDMDDIWAGFELMVFADRRLNGDTHFNNLKEASAYSFDSDNNIVEITTLAKKSFHYDLTSSWAFLESLLGKLSDEGADVVYSMGEYKSQIVNTITIASSNGGGNCSCILYIDPQTHRILAGTNRWKSKHDDEAVSTLITVNYPEFGPLTIYDTGVPKTADVIDLRE